MTTASTGLAVAAYQDLAAARRADVITSADRGHDEGAFGSQAVPAQPQPQAARTDPGRARCCCQALSNRRSLNRGWPRHRGLARRAACHFRSRVQTASPSSELFRLWLQRRIVRRSVKVKIRSGEQPPVKVEADGENISLQVLQSAVESALKASRDTKK